MKYINNEGEKMMFLAEQGEAAIDILLDQRINASDSEKEYIDSILLLNDGDLCYAIKDSLVPFNEVLFGEPWETKDR